MLQQELQGPEDDPWLSIFRVCSELAVNVPGLVTETSPGKAGNGMYDRGSTSSGNWASSKVANVVPDQLNQMEDGNCRPFVFLRDSKIQRGPVLGLHSI